MLLFSSPNSNNTDGSTNSFRIKVKTPSHFLLSKVRTLKESPHFMVKMKQKLQNRSIGKRFQYIIQLNDGNHPESNLKRAEFVPFVLVIPPIVLMGPKLIGYTVLVLEWIKLNKKIVSFHKQYYNNNYTLSKNFLTSSILVSLAIELVSLVSFQCREQFTLSNKGFILAIRMVPGFCYMISKIIENKNKSIDHTFRILFIAGLISFWPLSSTTILNTQVRPTPYTLYIEKIDRIDSKPQELKMRQLKTTKKTVIPQKSKTELFKKDIPKLNEKNRNSTFQYSELNQNRTPDTKYRSKN